MTLEELDVALEELETRLERLRALYEQYFLGFEKIEPQVARKDVDRRIYLLRREKIRNTGKRFKLQTIVMRYNTFQQYWQRICREIENGTYKRHLARAERILRPDQMKTIAARRRFGKSSVEELAADAAASDASPLDEIEAGELAVGESFPAEIGTDRAPLPAIPRSPTPSGLPAPPGSIPPAAAARSARPSKYESLTLEMDFLESWDPERSIRARHQGSAPKAPPPSAAVPPAPSSAPPRPVPPRPLPSSSPPTRPAPPRPGPSTSPARPLPSSSPPTRPAPPRAPTPRPIAPLAAPSPAASRDTPAPPAKPAGRVPPPKPAARVPPPKPASDAHAPGRPPAPAAAARAASPVKPEKPSAAARAETPKAGELSEQRIKELHEKLVRIKRENKEPGQVSVESLAKTLRATEEKLRAEHKGRRIEFEVVLRDGKAVVKPKVR